MAIWLNISNILYLVSYGVRDILLLRILSVVAMLVAMPYYIWNASEPAWVPITWNVAFMLINSWWVMKITLERMPPRFTPAQRKLYEYAFHHSCTPREMLQLLSKASWKQAQPGERLAQQGQLADRLIVLQQGEATVEAGGRELARLRDGDLVGEMSYLTREPMITSVTARGPLEYVEWTKEALDELFQHRMELKVAIQAVIGHNLVERLTDSVGSVPEVILSMSGERMKAEG